MVEEELVVTTVVVDTGSVVVTWFAARGVVVVVDGSVVVVVGPDVVVVGGIVVVEGADVVVVAAACTVKVMLKEEEPAPFVPVTAWVDGPPTTEGVPEIRPVADVNERPAGREGVTAHVLTGPPELDGTSADIDEPTVRVTEADV